MKSFKRKNKKSIYILQRSLNDYIRYLSDKKRLILTNLLAGVARGIGGALGFWIFSLILAKILTLLIPISDRYLFDKIFNLF